MSGKLKEMSVTAFMGLTASDAPASGGDSVSAFLGPLSATLTGMVAGLTVGKKKYVEVEAEMRKVTAAAEVLKKELVREIDCDPDSFNEFMAAMVLPRNMDEERAVQKAAMQNGLKSVAKVLCHVAETTTRIFPLAKAVVECDNTNVVTDGLAVAMATRTAVIGAGLNVKINLASIEDEDFVAEYSAHAAALGEQAIAAECEIFALSELTKGIQNCANKRSGVVSIQVPNSTLQIEAGAIMTLALAVLLLFLGAAVKNRVWILNHYRILALVVGGLLLVFLIFLGHVMGSFQVSFDTYFQSPFMLVFFMTAGLSVGSSFLKRGGVMLVVYWLILGVISVIQNVIGIAVGTVTGLPAPYALLSSAISMIGDHGATASHGAQFTEVGYDQAMLVGAATITFGLITVVMIGGPLSSQLIVRYKLTPGKVDSSQGSDVFEVNKSSGEARSAHVIVENITVLLVCMTAGAKVSALIGAVIGMSFPIHVGAMFVAVLVRNLNEKLRFFNFDYALTDDIGEVMLSLYPSMALMSLKLWELAGLVGGVLLVVCCQVILMILAAYFVMFRLLGSNYDAVVMCAGLCGHGLGATPSAIINMTAVTEKYGMPYRVFMIVSIVGAFLVGIIYQLQTTAFIRFLVHNVAAK